MFLSVLTVRKSSAKEEGKAMGDEMIFPENVIVFSYKPELIEKLSENEAIDFLPSIELPADKTVLDTWMKHFKERDVAFIVVRHKGKLKLWKKREVPI